MGRGAGGVKAISLGKKDRVVGAVALRKTGTTILVATEKGFGKRSETEEYRVSHRGGKGIFTVKTSDKTGMMVAIREVREADDIVVVTSGGIVIRQHASEIRVAGRNTQGVRLIKLDEKDTVSDVASVMSEDEDPETITGPERPSGPKAKNDATGEGGVDQNDLFADEKKTLKKAKAAKGKSKTAVVKGKGAKKEERPATPQKAVPKNAAAKGPPKTKPRPAKPKAAPVPARKKKR
jgi:DNA gyrase subunit A